MAGVPDPNDYDVRTERAQAAGEEANGRDPREHPFGFYSYGDAPGGIGGGVGVLLWFPTPESLLAYFSEHLTYQCHGPASSDETAVDASVKSAVATFEASGEPLENLIPVLNPILHNYSQIEWIGEFKDLAAGEREFEKRVRSSFRDADEEEENNPSSPIGPDQTDDFVEYLATYGS
jgi:hypothetical protein